MDQNELNRSLWGDKLIYSFIYRQYGARTWGPDEESVCGGGGGGLKSRWGKCVCVFEETEAISPYAHLSSVWNTDLMIPMRKVCVRVWRNWSDKSLCLSIVSMEPGLDVPMRKVGGGGGGGWSDKSLCLSIVSMEHGLEIPMRKSVCVCVGGGGGCTEMKR